MKDDQWYWNEIEKVFAEDRAMVDHTREVADHALILAQASKCDERTARILHLSALLHDIGIEEAERKHGSREGEFQHIEGPPIARDILERAGEEQSVIDRVTYLVAHHHHFDQVDGLDYQILIEADMLVNLREEHLSAQELPDFIENFFKTDAGKKRARKLYTDFSNS